MSSKIKILFVCTGNSCRSQMAEAWTRNLKGDQLEPQSAGLEAHGLDPLAIKVMEEVGIDISQQESKTLAEVKVTSVDYAVTVCDSAHESCPVVPGADNQIHIGFDDPPRLAAKATSEEEALDHYRRVRDEIRNFVGTLPENLPTLARPSPS